ncbi:MAG: peptide chain release factor N(5)-glutamine methyltransferase [Hyphomonadaceae bacterium]|nr:peptide chain release factor N(5)-glutamine methyltransferase [Clostridia bacterium]
MVMTIGQALQNSNKKLAALGNVNLNFDVTMLLCHVLKKDRLFLLTNQAQEIQSELYAQYLEMLERYALGQPLQYIIGSQEFMSLPFIVNENVLIPRQDTETLVEQVLARIAPDAKLHILDIGTGSGCIAISLAHYRKNLSVVAMDISSEALAVAKQNAINNQVARRISFLQQDVFTLWQDDKATQTFDIIVSNPPYITAQVVETLDKKVRAYEPYGALCGGKDGLDYYRHIIQNGKKALKQGGWMALEIGYDQREAVERLFRDHGYGNIETIKDYAGNDRVVSGNWA